MQYDPIKEILGRFFNKSVFLRTTFYRLLNLLLLRSWHIRKALNAFFIQKQNEPDIRILDAGSGFGQYTWVIARKNRKWQIDSIDIKQGQIDECKLFFNKAGLLNADFQFGDLVQYKRADSYDLILSVDVMEHIENDLQVFKNFYDSLKPGGVLLISTPSDQGGSDVKHDHQSSFIDEHVRDGYAINEIYQKLKSAGFKLVEAKYSYGTLGSISWRLSMKYPLMALGISKLFLVFLPLYYLLVFPFCLIMNYIDVIGSHKSGTGLIVRAVKTNN